MNTWFTSDLHLGHKAVIGFCNRPFVDVEEMDRHLIEKWNASVAPSDIIYCLGDLSFHKPSVGVPLLRGLNGQKVLIRGNHDKYSDTQYREAGFSILEEAKIKLFGRRLILSHYPYWEDLAPNHSGYEPRYPELRPANKGGWLLHGHVHEKWETRLKMINVGVDVRGFHPVSAKVIESFIQRAESQTDEG